MKTRELFDTMSNDPNWFEKLAKKFENQEQSFMLEVPNFWIGGPLIKAFDTKLSKFDVNTIPLDDKVRKAFEIVNKFLKEPNRQRAKSECAEELFNAGLKDYI